ncbi:MAG: efflux RND transporter periplasmic adaptor subunit [Panacibacter sp.]
MKKNNTIHYIRFLLVATTCFLFFCGCGSTDADDAAATETAPETVTPVTVTNVSVGNMSETVEVNATSSFLLKTYVKATSNGYLQLVNAQLGKFVSKGQNLFVIKTKEAEALGNTINSLDSSLHFEGSIHIKSPGSGYISQLNYTAGDYVMDGEQLATITDTKSFVFLLDLPYELKPYLASNKTLKLNLPDGTVLDGTVQSALPTVDSIAQTQRYIIRVNTSQLIPENLIAKVSLVKTSKLNTVSLPKAAVLSDEVQSEFWIMKMINDSTAVKVPVTKGMETKDKVEITAPQLSATDKILLTGNYGLADTAKVVVAQ